MTCANERCRLPVDHDGRCGEPKIVADGAGSDGADRVGSEVPGRQITHTAPHVRPSATPSAAGTGGAAAPPQPADDLVQRAAEVMAWRTGTRYPRPNVPFAALAQALADAGLLRDGPKLTDADEAVLDAARYLVTCAGAGINDRTVHNALAALCAAVER